MKQNLFCSDVQNRLPQFLRGTLRRQNPGEFRHLWIRKHQITEKKKIIRIATILVVVVMLAVCTITCIMLTSVHVLEHRLGQNVSIDTPLMFETDIAEAPDLGRITAYMPFDPAQEYSVSSVRTIHDFVGNPYLYVEFQPSGYCVYSTEFDEFLDSGTTGSGPFQDTDSEYLYYAGTYFVFEDGGYRNKVNPERDLTADKELVELAYTSIRQYQKCKHRAEVRDDALDESVASTGA